MPPLAVIVALPVPPLHATLVKAVLVVKADGWVTLADLLELQLLASVTVAVYTPNVRPVIAEVVPPFDHK